MQKKLKEIQQTLPWLERLDMINDLATLAPELTVQMAKHEQQRANLFAGNAKIKQYPTEEDPVLSDFKREMIFYRQAQSAVVMGIPKLHELGIKTKRPDDYFAEMAKADAHMQKVRQRLMAKQEGQAKSERIKQIREQRKMGKLVQKQARAQRDADKKDMLDKLKKFRKGKLKNLDFLEDNKSGKTDSKSFKKMQQDKRKTKDKKFGFGGKKRGMKRNTKESSIGGGGDGNKKFNKFAGPKGGAQRLGKNKRNKIKSKGGKGRK